MLKSLVWFLSSVVGSASLVAAAGVAQAQVYVEAGTDYYAGAEFYVGDTVHVYAADGAYDATVLQVSGPNVLVRYLDSAWGAQEWVDGSRLRLRQGGAQVVGYQPGIQIYWGNSWLDGTLLARRGNRYHVHYRGVSEWVTADRWHHRAGSHYRVPSYGRRVHGNHGWNPNRRNGDRHGQMRGDSQRGGRDHNDGGRKNGGRKGNDGGRKGGHGGGRGH